MISWRQQAVNCLRETLIGLEAGTIVPEKQDDSQAGEYARMLDKELGHIDF